MHVLGLPSLCEPSLPPGTCAWVPVPTFSCVPAGTFPVWHLSQADAGACSLALEKLLPSPGHLIALCALRPVQL